MLPVDLHFSLLLAKASAFIAKAWWMTWYRRDLRSHRLPQSLYQRLSETRSE
jgi:hypothetical protein